jgi:TolB-like protein
MKESGYPKETRNTEATFAPTLSGMETRTRSQYDRLESWKEIAGYLGRGVRTVQRWEREEGLPVHRQLHSKLGTVFGLKAELDAWRAGREEHADPPDDLAANAVPARGAALGSRGWVVAAGGVALALLVTTHSTGRPASSPADPTAPRLAVLPFRNLTGDPSADRLIEALADDTLVEMHRMEGDRLAVVSGRAIAPESPMAPPAAAVDYVLEGSIRQAGSQLRVAARLVREADGSLLWVASYDRPAGDVPIAQADLGRSIATGVSATLRP